ncbi:MAG: 50S ribosomal protein L25 [Candidatus Spyradenecus sp.]
MNQITLNASVRTEQGSKAAGRLRRAGKIPGVIKRMSGESTLIELDAHAYDMTMRAHHGDQLLVSIDLGGTKLSALLRETQHDVMTGKVSHVDFGEVDMGHTVRVEIAINLVGTPDGVKNANGVLEQELRAIHVDCLPSDIVESFDIDVSALKVGDSLLASQLNLGEKYHVTTHKDTVVAAVVAADEEIELPAAAPADGAAAEPEVIGAKKADAADAPAKK